MNFVEFLKQLQSYDNYHADKYGDWLGYNIKEVKKEEMEVTTTLEIRDDHLSPSRAVHGGVISGFLDFSCGCAVFATLEKEQLTSTVELNVKYFKPLREGDKVYAVARVVNRGKTLCSVLADMYVEGKEKPVALATGTFNIYPLSKVMKKS
jgi:uncharacterized protein (TIGR00369 family)